ncbi:hypothetical protein DFP95_12268 [Cohnella lupini]|uniref:Uncharacterized protein n=1 Tax=Cohnella lupini TaxID=1294267 RepID=A0A3D9HZ41_9BACL|nr:hypothetical protein DFP95_12268 [Cohnella lupini]
MSMLRLLIICIMVCELFTTKVHASRVQPQSDVPPFEVPYFEIGYKSVEQALKECELHNQRKIILPVKLPSVEFTHHIGRCNKDPNDMNDEFQIEYLNEKQSMNHYNIDVRPIEQKLNFAMNKRVQSYKLTDGSEARYFTTVTPKIRGGFNILVFEKNGWQYRLSVDTRIQDRVTQNTLLEIAQSIR